MATTVKYTETFFNTVSDQVDHLSTNINNHIDGVVERIGTLINHFESNALSNPLMYAVCPELQTLGVYEIRQYSSNGFKLLYQYDEASDTVTGLVLIRDRQNLQSALVDYCIMHR